MRESGGRQVDREAWAAQVSQMLITEAGGKKTKLAVLLGVTTKTIDRWLKGEVAVSEHSIREVARRLGRDPMRLLASVGYYSDSEIQRAEVRWTDPPEILDEETVQMVRESDLPDVDKEAILEELRRQERADRERRRTWLSQLLQWRRP